MTPNHLHPKILSVAEYRNILRRIAEEHHTTQAEVEREMIRSIDDAWASPSPLQKTRQAILFKGLNRKPTPREFISTMADFLH